VPFYEYRRPDGTTFEVLQKMSDDALTHDPDTGVPVERVFSPIAIHFKGKGFYNTDYGTKKRNREKAASSSSSSSSDSSSSSGSSDSSSSSSSSSSSDGAKAGSSSGSSGSSGSKSSSSSSD
jgi:putative FmdB family regulatory protein